ncbi:hypothetical protein Tco_0150202 [Tanacetum coccineum]
MGFPLYTTRVLPDDSKWWLSSRVSEAVVGLVLPPYSLAQLSFVCQPKDSGPDLVLYFVGLSLGSGVVAAEWMGVISRISTQASSSSSLSLSSSSPTKRSSLPASDRLFLLVVTELSTTPPISEFVSRTSVCAVTHMDSSESTGSCAAGNASTATPRKLVSSSTVDQSMAGRFEDCRVHFGVLLVMFG